MQINSSQTFTYKLKTCLVSEQVHQQHHQTVYTPEAAQKLHRVVISYCCKLILLPTPPCYEV